MEEKAEEEEAEEEAEAEADAEAGGAGDARRAEGIAAQVGGLVSLSQPRRGFNKLKSPTDWERIQ